MRLSSLDGLRGLGALFVVLVHTCAAGTSASTREVLGDTGALAVEMFFLLSGYVLTREWRRGRERREGFLRRRVARLVPGYLLVSAVTMVYAYSQDRLTGRMVLRELTLTQVLGTDEPLVLLQAWTLGVEAAFYVLLPFVLILLLPRTRRTQVAVLGALSLAGLSLRPVLDATGIDLGPLHGLLLVSDHLLFFLTGVGLAMLVGELRFRPGLFLAAVALSVGWIALLQLGADTLPKPVDLLVRVVACALIVGSAPRALPGTAWMGRVSYSAYLWHWVVLLFLKHQTPLRELPSVLLFVIVAGVTFTLAAVTTSRFEAPAQRSLLVRLSARVPHADRPMEERAW